MPWQYGMKLLSSQNCRFSRNCHDWYYPQDDSYFLLFAPKPLQLIDWTFNGPWIASCKLDSALYNPPVLNLQAQNQNYCSVTRLVGVIAESAAIENLLWLTDFHSKEHDASQLCRHSRWVTYQKHFKSSINDSSLNLVFIFHLSN